MASVTIFGAGNMRTAIAGVVAARATPEENIIADSRARSREPEYPVLPERQLALRINENFSSTGGSRIES